MVIASIILINLANENTLFNYHAWNSVLHLFLSRTSVNYLSQLNQNSLYKKYLFTPNLILSDNEQSQRHMFYILWT